MFPRKAFHSWQTLRANLEDKETTVRSNEVFSIGDLNRLFTEQKQESPTEDLTGLNELFSTKIESVAIPISVTEIDPAQELATCQANESVIVEVIQPEVTVPVTPGRATPQRKAATEASTSIALAAETDSIQDAAENQDVIADQVQPEVPVSTTPGRATRQRKAISKASTPIAPASAAEIDPVQDAAETQDVIVDKVQPEVPVSATPSRTTRQRKTAPKASKPVGPASAAENDPAQNATETQDVIVDQVQPEVRVSATPGRPTRQRKAAPKPAETKRPTRSRKNAASDKEAQISEPMPLDTETVAPTTTRMRSKRGAAVQNVHATETEASCESMQVDDAVKDPVPAKRPTRSTRQAKISSAVVEDDCTGKAIHVEQEATQDAVERQDSQSAITDACDEAVVPSTAGRATRQRRVGSKQAEPKAKRATRSRRNVPSDNGTEAEETSKTDEADVKTVALAKTRTRSTRQTTTKTDVIQIEDSTEAMQVDEDESPVPPTKKTRSSRRGISKTAEVEQEAAATISTKTRTRSKKQTAADSDSSIESLTSTETKSPVKTRGRKPNAETVTKTRTTRSRAAKTGK